MKKLFTFFLGTLVFLSIIAGCTKGSAKQSSSVDTSLQSVMDKNQLVVGLDDTLPPLGYIDSKTGNLVGFDVDLAREAGRRMGVDVVFQPIDWASKEMELNNGNVDCLWNGLSKTKPLEKALNLSFAYMRNHQCAMVKKDSPYYILEDLNQKIVCVQTDSSGDHALSNNLALKNSLKDVIDVNSFTKGIMELHNGTVDAIIIDETIARFYVSNAPERYRILTLDNGTIASLDQEDYVVGFRKKDEALKLAVEKVLMEMAEEGKTAEISEQWFGSDITCVLENDHSTSK